MKSCKAKITNIWLERILFLFFFLSFQWLDSTTIQPESIFFSIAHTHTACDYTSKNKKTLQSEIESVNPYRIMMKKNRNFCIFVSPKQQQQQPR